MTRMVFKICFAVWCLVCGGSPCFASQFMRAWVVEWQSQRTILLGTDHALPLNEQDMPLGILEEIRHSSQVFLETFPLPSPDRQPKPLNWAERRLPNQLGLLLELKAPAIGALKKLFPVMADFTRWASAKPGATYYAAREETLHRMLEIRNYYAHSLQAVMEKRLDRTFLDKNFEPFIMDPALMNEVNRLFRKTDPLDVVNWIAEHPRPAYEFKGVDWLIERWALANGKALHGLSEFEPYPRGERLYLQLVEAGDLDQALRNMEARLNRALGSIYYYDSIIRGAVLEMWSAHNYFGHLSAQDYAHKQRELNPPSLAVVPSIKAVEDYNFERHRHWFKGLKEMAKTEPLFVAVGLEHLIDHPSGTPSLLKLFKRAGFKVNAWSECETRLQI